MKIESVTENDLEEVLDIYAEARSFMRENGNDKQWVNGYPDRTKVLSDIKNGRLYKVIDATDILGVFYFLLGNDKTYSVIYDGEWLNSEPYGVIHRIAVAKNAHGKGVGAFCFNYALGISGNLKIDTHRDNLPMQRALVKFGFKYCGIIHLENGDERLAYQISK